MEEWRAVLEFPGYWASDLGRIRSGDKILKPTPKPGKWNYLQVQVWAGDLLCEHCNRRKNSRQYHRTVHSLVMLAFKGPRPEGMQIGHLDGNPLNNNVSNLKYVTGKQNAEHREAHGTVVRGTKHWKAKLSEDQVRKIRKMALRTNHKAIAEIFEISPANAQAVINRKTWKHIN